MNIHLVVSEIFLVEEGIRTVVALVSRVAPVAQSIHVLIHRCRAAENPVANVAFVLRFPVAGGVEMLVASLPAGGKLAPTRAAGECHFGRLEEER